MIGSNTYLSLAAKPSWSQCWNKEQLAGLWTLRHRTSQQRNHSTKVMPFKPKLRCYGLTTAIYRGYLSSTKSLGYLSSISSKVPQIQRHWNHSSYLIRCAQVLAQIVGFGLWVGYSSMMHDKSDNFLTVHTISEDAKSAKVCFHQVWKLD